MFKYKKKETVDPKRRGQDLFSKYIDDYKRDLISFITKKSFTKLEGEPLPPWFCYHYPLNFNHEEMEALGIGALVYSEKESFHWFTLDAGIYTNSFLEYFWSLAYESQKDYFLKYDLGPSWKDRKNWFDVLFDAVQLSDGEYERAYDDIISKA